MLIQALPFLPSLWSKVEHAWYKIAPPAPPVKPVPLRKNNSKPKVQAENRPGFGPDPGKN